VLADRIASAARVAFTGAVGTLKMVKLDIAALQRAFDSKR
jgi:hypothetical protein